MQKRIAGLGWVVSALLLAAEAAAAPAEAGRAVAGRLVPGAGSPCPAPPVAGAAPAEPGCQRAAFPLGGALVIEGIREPVDGFGGGERGLATAVQAGDVQAESYTLNGKLVAGLGHLQPYVSAGFGLLEASGVLRGPDGRVESSGLEIAARFGGGIALRASEHVSLFVDTAYTLSAGEIPQSRYFGLGWGMRYRF